MGPLAEAAKAVKEQFPNVKVIEVEVDVRKTEQVEAGIKKTVETFGRLVCSDSCLCSSFMLCCLSLVVSLSSSPPPFFGPFFLPGKHFCPGSRQRLRLVAQRRR